jgi:TonB-linked SusC/RagA family outer membrane protein
MKKYINIFKHLILFLFFWFSSGGIINAQNVVNGSVVDLSGYPVIGAKIISGNDTVIAKNNGSFSVSELDVITVISKGYRPQTIKPPFNHHLVVLEKDPLHQSVDVAFGSQKSLGLTSAVSSVRSEDLKDAYVTNIRSTLSGKLAGLTVIPTSGEPGNDFPAFYIRGIGTLNNMQPLEYVDGLEMPINMLKLEEIESISVLKDAAALALFGIKGANGVIWVTTKRGKIGPAQVKTSLQTGIQQPNILPKFVDSYDYARLYNEAKSNDNGNIWSPFYSDVQLNAYKNPENTANDKLLYPNVNWYDEVLRKSAPLSNADVSVSGGNENIRYFLFFGYQFSGGLYSDTDPKKDVNANNEYQKVNVRTNVDIKLPLIFDAKVTFGGVIDNRYTPSYDVSTLWQNMASYPANAFPVETPLGWGGTSIYPNNPKATVLQRGFRLFHNRNLQASLALGQNFDFVTKGLRLTETFSIYDYESSAYYKDRNYQRFQPYYNVSGDSIGYNVTGSPETFFTITQTGTGLNDVKFRQNLQFALTYDRLFYLHHFQGSLLYNEDKYMVEGNNPTYLFRGFSGRLNYGFDDKYFAEIGYALNGTGDFPPGKNMGFFPTLSLAWAASQEDFMKSSSVVNYLKFRGSVGLVGNNNIGGTRFAYQQYYQSGTAGPRFNTTGTSTASTLFESTIANPSLTWEKAFKADFGIDARLFNKLDAVVDLFYDRRTDILVNQNSLASLGFLNGKANDGVVTNKGIEINLNWKDQIGNMTYYINPVFSFSRNKIVNMNELPQAEDYLAQTGYSINQPFALEASGLFQTWDEINNPNTPVQTFAAVQPGDIRYVDQNNDGAIDNNDRIALKGYYSEIPEITYGLNVGVVYKGFDLNVSGYGVANRSVYLDGVNFYAFQNNGNASNWALNRWVYYPDQNIDTRGTATYPRLSLGSNSNNFRNSSFWIRNGNYFRLGELTLGYSLPRSFTMRAKIQKVRIFISGKNLLTVDKIDTVDPEVRNGYPLMKNYNLGLNVNF